MAEKKQYPFNYRHFDYQLTGVQVAGCKYPPRLSFTPTNGAAKNKGIYANGYFNHESMSKPFSQFISFDDFRMILNVIEYIANAPENGEQIVKQIPFKFFKDREFKRSGVSLGVVRDKEGVIYFAFKSKQIPTIPFKLLPKGTTELLDADGQGESKALVSKIEAQGWVQKMRAMLDDSVKGLIEDDGMPSTNNNSSTTSNDTNSPVDFDDDIDESIPF